MPRIVANGITTHYQQAGDGPDIVLIHGLTGDLSIWYLQAMPALAREFRVTAYDLRGHGHSEMTPSGYTSAHFAADLDGLLEALGIEHAHLVGYSFGASVALHCALLHPSRVASLILAEPWVAALQALVDFKTWPGREAARARFRARGLDIPEERWLDLDYVLREAVRVHRERGPVGQQPEPVHLRVPNRGTGAQPGEIWRALSAHWFPPGRRLQRLMDDTRALKEAVEVAGLTLDRLAEIRQPVRAIYGDFSPFLPVAGRLEESMPNCRVVVLRGTGHYIAVADPEILVEAVREFLRELSPDGVAATASATPRQ